AIDAALITLGVAIVINSRPFEGAVWTMLAGATVLVLLTRPQASPAAMLSRLILPTAAVAVPVAAFMLYYDFRVTGDPLTLPYSLHARQYMQVPLFFWSRPPPQKVQYPNAAMREHYDRYERAY